MGQAPPYIFMLVNYFSVITLTKCELANPDSIYITKQQREEILVMTKQIFVILISLSILGLTGCVQTQIPQEAYNFQRPQKMPSLEEQLDGLYRHNRGQWKNKIMQSLKSGNSKLPNRHLVLAMKSFNTLKQRDFCLEAAFQYLDKQARAGKNFQGENRQLFYKLVEYTLKNPEAFDINRLHYICGQTRDNICDQLR